MWFCLGGLVEQRLQWELFTPGPGWNVFVSLVTCIIKLTFGHHTGLIPERNIFFFFHISKCLLIRHALPRGALETWRSLWFKGDLCTVELLEAVFASLELIRLGFFTIQMRLQRLC